MKIQIQNWDNSCAIRLNDDLINQLNIKVGDELDGEVKDGILLLKPAAPIYTMSELLSGCTKQSMKQTDEDSDWLNTQPVGKEIIE